MLRWLVVVVLCCLLVRLVAGGSPQGHRVISGQMLFGVRCVIGLVVTVVLQCTIPVPVVMLAAQLSGSAPGLLSSFALVSRS